MSTNQTVTFQDIIEKVESLPEQQQQDLIEIIKNRLIENRRESLAKNIRQAKKEYIRGEIKKGNVDDLLKELDE